VEIYIPSLGRFVHADPCENSLDAPMTYEKGWNKKLSYVFSFSRYGVTDVIHRYSRKFTSSVCHNRSLCSEKFVQERVQALDQEVQSVFSQRILSPRSGVSGTTGGSSSSSEVIGITLARLRQGSSAFTASRSRSRSSLSLPSELSLQEISRRKSSHMRDLQMLAFMPIQSNKMSRAELQGRVSGDAAWKKARGEGHGTSGSTSGVSKGGVLVVSYRDVDGMKWLREVSKWLFVFNVVLMQKNIR
jgi:hypothetical protein